MDFRKTLSKGFRKLKHRTEENTYKKRGASGSDTSTRDGRETDVKGGEGSQRKSVDSKPGRGGETVGRKTWTAEHVNPPPVPTPEPAISHNDDGNPGGMRIDRDQEDSHPNQNEPNAADENKTNSPVTVIVEGKRLVLRMSRSGESRGMFGPLMAVAVALCNIMVNYEQTRANNQLMESLEPRINAVNVLLCKPASQRDIKETSRRNSLERKLKNFSMELDRLKKQGEIVGFVGNADNAGQLSLVIVGIRDAMLEYQTPLQRDDYDKSLQLIAEVERMLLDNMDHIVDAGYRHSNQEGCLQGTRRNVLQQLEDWLGDEQGKQVFWLNGLAGTGKSSISQTFAQTASAEGKLGASFFCSREYEARSNLRQILPTLAFQLAYQYTLFRDELLQVLRENPGIGRESLCSQMEKLIVGPFQMVTDPTLIIIDALDECRDEEPMSAFLSVLSHYLENIPLVKFYIAARPEIRIRHGFRLKLLCPHTEVLRLHDLEPFSVNGDIKLFLKTQLTAVINSPDNHNFMEDWPSPEDIETLCKKAGGFFTYASTIVKFVGSPNHSPNERLALVVSEDTSHEARLGIGILYTQVLEEAFGNQDQEFYSHLKSVLGIVLLVFRPFSINAISDLIGNCGPPSRIYITLRSLHSLLLIPDKMEDPVHTFHKSFPDFLTDPERCGGKWFFLDPSTHHGKILVSCLDLMKQQLKKNICGLGDYVVLSEVGDLPVRREKYIRPSLEYACHFWTNHLTMVSSDSPNLKKISDAIEGFFARCFLYWVEVLILTGRLDTGVHVLNDVEQWYIMMGLSCKWINDNQRFLSKFSDTIRNSPSLIYQLEVVHSPSSLLAGLPLDQSSPEFSNQLNKVLYGQEYEKCVQNFQMDDPVWFVDYLDKAVNSLDPSSSTSRKCIRELRGICGTHTILPTSYLISSHLLTVDSHPFGSGGFCEVYRGTFGTTAVCVKRLPVSHWGISSEATKMFCREAVIWKYLDHPNILPLLGATISPPQLISVFMPAGDLSKYIEENPNADRIRLLHGIADGLCYLHSHNVIHGDLKGMNVLVDLVDGAPHALIADFGIAIVTKNLDSARPATYQSHHTPTWSAPEVLRGENPSKESDVYSFAMIMVEVLSGKVPFNDLKTNWMVVVAVLEGKRPPRPAHPSCTDYLWMIIQRCWDKDPELRPEIPEVSQTISSVSTN